VVVRLYEVYLSTGVRSVCVTLLAYTAEDAIVQAQITHPRLTVVTRVCPAREGAMTGTVPA
jgi:hypothetical protein